MGIDIEGGMIVGESGRKLESPDEELDLNELAEENDMDYMSLYYDADEEDRIYGFKVNDVLVDDMEEWLSDVKEKAKRFKQLTGIDARLIGTQDVW